MIQICSTGLSYLEIFIKNLEMGVPQTWIFEICPYHVVCFDFHQRAGDRRWTGWVRGSGQDEDRLYTLYKYSNASSFVCQLHFEKAGIGLSSGGAVIPSL